MGIGNSEDPDQTAPLGAVWSGSALFAQTYLSEDFESIRYVCSLTLLSGAILINTDKCLYGKLTKSIIYRWLSFLMKKLSSGFLTRSDTNQAEQPQKMARGLKFQI